MPASIDWYFDFVSPFSYISLYRLKELPVQVSYKPVLFAGLLKHWGQKGPAEIPLDLPLVHLVGARARHHFSPPRAAPVQSAAASAPRASLRLPSRRGQTHF
jgi:2-hydroxychromene-2-carboxylate isomerase